MKHILSTLVILLTLATCVSCKKNKEDVVAPGGENFKIADYLVVGETWWGNSVNNTPPYIIDFMTGGKVIIYRLGERVETTYQVNGNRITLADMGYIDIENGQVFMLLSGGGANLKAGKLLKKNNTSLVGKRFTNGKYWIWKSTEPAYYSASIYNCEVEIGSTKIREKYMMDAVITQYPVTQESGYTPISANAGFKEDKTANSHFLFFENPADGKLVIWFYNGAGYRFYKF